MARRRNAESRSPGTREKILEAAERLIAAHGADGFQLKDAADAVGIRPPSVHAHFESRDAICRAIAHRLYDGVMAAVRLDQTGDPMEALLQLLDDYVRYLADRPAHLRLVLRDLAHTAFPTEGQQTPSPEEAWQVMLAAFRTPLQRGIDTGRFRPLRPDSVQAQLVGAITANLCWGDWDKAGNPIAGVPIEEIVRQTQDLAVRLLRISDDRESFPPPPSPPWRRRRRPRRRPPPPPQLRTMTPLPRSCRGSSLLRPSSLPSRDPSSAETSPWQAFPNSVWPTTADWRTEVCGTSTTKPSPLSTAVPRKREWS